MSAENTVCPYPGLRPFTEEESIYFRGREEQIQKIIECLEEKKFLMLTGASGDGKSSLVYAGVIPNARAGFFKARFNNWIIADFRPERAPLKNMAKSLARHLEIKDEKNVERELSFGFSSLINLYKSSPYHLDYGGKEYLKADEKQQKALKRKAANLMILVDQFEEFFTNAENYTNGRPSVNSQTVVNLLLETVRIALEQDLPVYIVCTMRSDYIGQCASFRGLPEYIGFSQFFVPRLKRKEIHQVVAEPALLNGNKISNRLTETLINELGDGFDQLPVLQHALNQIWRSANTNNEEMDLIHLAKLSGLPADHLPENDKVIFKEWLKDIPEFKKNFFNKPSLENVLDSHANELYEKAFVRYSEQTKGKQDVLSAEEAKGVIKKVFQCLTKIDDSRAVRNRMTLQDTVNIINDPKVTTGVVAGLLDIFRRQGSTFVRPFIADGGEGESLNADDVLDITHESLIRNWALLTQWTDEENEHWLTFQDFNKQLQRWVKNNRSAHYLLPLGSLTFFEEWYNSCKPNKYWLKKYDEGSDSDSEKEKKAQKTIEDAVHFLKSSRSAIRRKRNILIFATVSIIILLSGFSVWAVLERGKALRQEQFANEKTEEALKAKEEAIASKNAAEAAQQKAHESENIAVAAKDTALMAKEQALRSQNEAMQSKGRAEMEARHAEEQSLIAKKEAENAETQRKISVAEKEKAEKAELKARQLSFISVSQNLALKSVIQTDPQLQGLLAMQAYRYVKQNGGQVQDPAVYEALRAAGSSLTSPVIMKGSNSEIRTMAEPQGASLLSAGKDGLLNKWDVNGLKLQSSSELKYRSPISFMALEPNGSLIVTGHDNNTVCVWNVSGGGKMNYIEMKGHKGLLRAVAFGADGSTVATAGKDSILMTWDVKSGKLIKSIIIGSYVKAMQFINGNSIVVATEDGDIEVVSLSDQSINKIFSSKTSLPLCVSLINKKNTLAVGFSDGRIRLFDINSSSGKFKQINDNMISVELISVNNKGNILAAACSDKSIKIYNLDNLEMKPIQLKDHRTKVRSMLFSNDEKLIAGCEDKTIRVWETSSDKLADKLCPALKRNMTTGEWKQFVGDKIQYEKTCGNLR